MRFDAPPPVPLVSQVTWLSLKRNNWANPNSFFPFSELKCHVSVLKWPGDQNRSNMWIRMVFRMVFSVQHDSNNRVVLRPFLCINDKIYRPSPRQTSSQTPHTAVPIFPIPQVVNQMADIEKATGPGVYCVPLHHISPTNVTHLPRAWPP